jgi:hypothetical protein
MNPTHRSLAAAAVRLTMLVATLSWATASHAQFFRVPVLGAGAAGTGTMAQASGTAQSTGAIQSAAAFQASGAKPLTTVQLAQLFDFNKNGKLDPAEISLVQNGFAIMGGNKVANAGNTANAQAALLKQFDANRNGKLDLAEAEFAMFALSGLAVLAGRPMTPFGNGMTAPNGMAVGGIGAPGVGAAGAGQAGAGGAAVGQMGNGKAPKGGVDPAPKSTKKGKSKRAAQLLADFDANRDGKLDADEREAAKHAGSSTARAKPREHAANANAAAKPRKPAKGND